MNDSIKTEQQQMMKEIKAELSNYLDGIYTSNKYWVTGDRRMCDGRFQEILEIIEKDFLKLIKKKLKELI